MIKFTKNNPEFESIKWVLQVNRKKDERKHTKYAYVKASGEDKFIVKTDGGRLHKYKLEIEMKEGFYEVIKNSQLEVILGYVEEQEELSYPDYENLFEIEGMEKKAEDVEMKWNKQLNEWNCYSDYAVIIRAMKNNTISYEYLRDVLSHNSCFDVHFKDSESQQIYKKDGSSREAVLMPYQI